MAFFLNCWTRSPLRNNRFASRGMSWRQHRGGNRASSNMACRKRLSRHSRQYSCWQGARAKYTKCFMSPQAIHGRSFDVFDAREAAQDELSGVTTDVVSVSLWNNPWSPSSSSSSSPSIPVIYMAESFSNHSNSAAEGSTLAGV